MVESIKRATLEYSTNVSNQQRGLGLIEIMIVVAIIGILAAFAYPNYQQYVIKSKRTDMMSEMHNIASEIQSHKLSQGSYSEISAAAITDFTKNYPSQSPVLYAVSLTPNPLTSEWTIIATPEPNTQVATDGNLSLNHQGIKCRASICGTGEEWNK